MSKKLSAIIIETISALLIFLFVYTVISKLIHHNQSLYTLGRSPLVKSFKTLIAWIIPIGELCISLLLLIPKWRLLGLLASFFLMSIFSIYIGYMLIFVPNLPCSCGGIIQQLTWKEHLLFNIGITIFALTGFLLYKRSKIFIAINRLSRKPV